MPIKKIILVAILIPCVFSCQNSDYISEEEGNKETVVVETVNAKMNKWAYSQMKHHYLFNTDLPDSVSLDFELEFPDFYKKIKSSKDRFSYYTTNNDYKGSVVASLSPLIVNRNIGDYDFVGSRASISGSYVEMVEVLKKTERKIGYIKYAAFETTSDLRIAFQELKDSIVTDLVVDLRNNGGGYVNTAMFLCSLIMPKEYYGKDAQYLKYNDIVTEELYQKEGKRWETYRFYDNDKFQAYALNLHKVYFLVNGGTASASESTINSLKPYMDVVVIGQTTVGKGTGMYSLSDNNYRYTLVPLTFRYYNVNWESVPDTGLVPDYIMPDNTGKFTYGSPDEPYLAKAIELIMQDKHE